MNISKMSTSQAVLILIGFLVFAVLSIVFFPLLYIWCLNTLVPALAIPYTLKTWFAMVIVKLFMLGGLSAVTLRNSINKISK